MLTYIQRRHDCWPYRVFCGFVAFTFIFSLILPSGASAQTVSSLLNLPAPGTVVNPTPAFTPALMRGVMLHPEDALKFDFIIEKGDSKLEGEAFTQEAKKLIKYFLAALTVPEKQMWVNLSPYEKDRIIPGNFGQTEMGRDLLAQDYLLKQLTASLMVPEKEIGDAFWKRVHQKAKEKFGTEDIPMNTFNKIWIVPEKAAIYENEKGAFIVESHLKVMLDEDYLALDANKDSIEHGLGNVKKEDLKVISGVQSEVIKEVLIPEIEKEVNEGKTFINLRQIYNAVILANWYKQALKESFLGKIYVDQAKTKGVDVDDKNVNQKIYERYVEAFKKGVYSYIKEEYDPTTQAIIPRKYFSGGVNMDEAMFAKASTRTAQIPTAIEDASVFTTTLEGRGPDAAMLGTIQAGEALKAIDLLLKTKYNGRGDGVVRDQFFPIIDKLRQVDPYADGQAILESLPVFIKHELIETIAKMKRVSPDAAMLGTIGPEDLSLGRLLEDSTLTRFAPMSETGVRHLRVIKENLINKVELFSKNILAPEFHGSFNLFPGIDKLRQFNFAFTASEIGDESGAITANEILATVLYQRDLSLRDEKERRQIIDYILDYLPGSSDAAMLGRREFLKALSAAAFLTQTKRVLAQPPVGKDVLKVTLPQGNPAVDYIQAYSWMLSQIDPKTDLVHSFEDLPKNDPSYGVTWIYNQAQAIEAALALNDQATAERLARGITNLESTSAHVYRANGGRWYNAYMTDSGKPANKIDDQTKGFIGANMALAHALLNVFETTSDKELAKSILNRIDNVNRTLTFQDKGTYGFIMNGPFETFTETASTEYNQRVVAFYYQLYRQLKDDHHKNKDVFDALPIPIEADRLKEKADKIIRWLQDKMWDKDRGLYLPGYKNVRSEIPYDLEDPGIWWGYAQYFAPIMASIAGLDPKPFSRGLDWLMKQQVQLEINGQVYQGLPRVIGTSSIWGKGTAETVVALQTVGRNQEAQEFLRTLAALQQKSGGVLAAVGEPSKGWPQNFAYAGFEATSPVLVAAGKFGSKFIADMGLAVRNNVDVAMLSNKSTTDDLETALEWLAADSGANFDVGPTEKEIDAFIHWIPLKLSVRLVISDFFSRWRRKPLVPPDLQENIYFSQHKDGSSWFVLFTVVEHGKLYRYKYSWHRIGGGNLELDKNLDDDAISLRPLVSIPWTQGENIRLNYDRATKTFNFIFPEEILEKIENSGLINQIEINSSRFNTRFLSNNPSDAAMMSRRMFVVTGAFTFANWKTVLASLGPLEFDSKETIAVTVKQNLNQLTFQDPEQTHFSEEYKTIVRLGASAIPALKAYAEDITANTESRKWAIRLIGEVGAKRFHYAQKVLNAIIKDNSGIYKTWQRQEGLRGLKILNYKHKTPLILGTKQKETFNQVNSALNLLADDYIAYGTEPYQEIITIGQKAIPSLIYRIRDSGADTNSRKWAIDLLVEITGIKDGRAESQRTRAILKEIIDDDTGFYQQWHKDKASEYFYNSAPPDAAMLAQNPGVSYNDLQPKLFTEIDQARNTAKAMGAAFRVYFMDIGRDDWREEFSLSQSAEYAMREILMRIEIELPNADQYQYRLVNGSQFARINSGNEVIIQLIRPGKAPDTAMVADISFSNLRLALANVKATDHQREVDRLVQKLNFDNVDKIMEEMSPALKAKVFLALQGLKSSGTQLDRAMLGEVPIMTPKGIGFTVISHENGSYKISFMNRDEVAAVTFEVTSGLSKAEIEAVIARTIGSWDKILAEDQEDIHHLVLVAITEKEMMSKSLQSGETPIDGLPLRVKFINGEYAAAYGQKVRDIMVIHDEGEITTVTVPANLSLKEIARKIADAKIGIIYGNRINTQRIKEILSKKPKISGAQDRALLANVTTQEVNRVVTQMSLSSEVNGDFQHFLAYNIENASLLRRYVSANMGQVNRRTVSLVMQRLRKLIMPLPLGSAISNENLASYYDHKSYDLRSVIDELLNILSDIQRYRPELFQMTSMIEGIKGKGSGYFLRFRANKLVKKLEKYMSGASVTSKTDWQIITDKIKSIPDAAMNAEPIETAETRLLMKWNASLRRHIVGYDRGLKTIFNLTGAQENSSIIWDRANRKTIFSLWIGGLDKSIDFTVRGDAVVKVFDEPGFYPIIVLKDTAIEEISAKLQELKEVNTAVVRELSTVSDHGKKRSNQDPVFFMSESDSKKLPPPDLGLTLVIKELLILARQYRESGNQGVPLLRAMKEVFGGVTARDYDLAFDRLSSMKEFGGILDYEARQVWSFINSGGRYVYGDPARLLAERVSRDVAMTASVDVLPSWIILELRGEKTIIIRASHPDDKGAYLIDYTNPDQGQSINELRERIARAASKLRIDLRNRDGFTKKDLENIVRELMREDDNAMLGQMGQGKGMETVPSSIKIRVQTIVSDILAIDREAEEAASTADLEKLTAKLDQLSQELNTLQQPSNSAVTRLIQTIQGFIDRKKEMVQERMASPERAITALKNILTQISEDVFTTEVVVSRLRASGNTRTETKLRSDVERDLPLFADLQPDGSWKKHAGDNAMVAEASLGKLEQKVRNLNPGKISIVELLKDTPFEFAGRDGIALAIKILRSPEFEKLGFKEVRGSDGLEWQKTDAALLGGVTLRKIADALSLSGLVRIFNKGKPAPEPSSWANFMANHDKYNQDIRRTFISNMSNSWWSKKPDTSLRFSPGPKRLSVEDAVTQFMDLIEKNYGKESVDQIEGFNELVKTTLKDLGYNMTLGTRTYAQYASDETEQAKEYIEYITRNYLGGLRGGVTPFLYWSADLLKVNGELDVNLFLADLKLPPSHKGPIIEILRGPQFQEMGMKEVEGRNGERWVKTDIGGIDLNPNIIKVNTRKDGKGVEIPVPTAPTGDWSNIEGFVPNIINVTPVTNLPLLLGVTEPPKPAQVGFNQKLDPANKPELAAREEESLSLL